MELNINIEIRKNYKFKGGYNIRGREGIFFFDDIKDESIDCENDKIKVPYVYYDRHYRKHMQDTAYFSIEEFFNIKNKIKGNKSIIKKLSIDEINEIEDEVLPVVTIKWSDGLKIYENMRIYKEGKFVICDNVKTCWFAGRFNKNENSYIGIYKEI